MDCGKARRIDPEKLPDYCLTGRIPPGVKADAMSRYERPENRATGHDPAAPLYTDESYYKGLFDTKEEREKRRTGSRLALCAVWECFQSGVACAVAGGAPIPDRRGNRCR